MSVLEIVTHHPDDVERFNFVQDRYSYHGLDDVSWTDSIDTVLQWLKDDLKRIEKGE
jgi:hypothetical protein